MIGLFVFLNSIFQGNAEKSRIIMVGDTLKKAGDSSGGRLLEAKDFGDTQYAINILHFIISLNEFWIKLSTLFMISLRKIVSSFLFFVFVFIFFSLWFLQEDAHGESRIF